MNLLRTGLLALLLAPATAFPCSRVTPIKPAEMVRDAHLIVVARAVGYERPPASSTRRRPARPESRIRFEVDEWVKGKGPTSLVLPGYLDDVDDYNDREPPYDFVRRAGRGGSCYATFYRIGAPFLLVLKLENGEYTPAWYALGPTNEQLRDMDDPWLLWVRDQVRATR